MSIDTLRTAWQDLGKTLTPEQRQLMGAALAELLGHIAEDHNAYIEKLDQVMKQEPISSLHWYFGLGSGSRHLYDQLREHLLDLGGKI